jgi:uncharacterized repeat protein (TIGR01451 family)
MKNIFKSAVLMVICLLALLVLPELVGEAQSAGGDAVGPDEQDKITQEGPPWLDEAWHYRQPVILSNLGAYLPYYQVLIRLDNVNFNFSHAKSDGADIRFTDSSGKNGLSYWIESWDSQNKRAYIWVLVSSIAPEPQATTIFMYYGNSSAASASNGLTTFDFFDDFSQFSSVACSLALPPQANQPFSQYQAGSDGTPVIPDQAASVNSWCVISGTPVASSGILTLNGHTGIKSTNWFQYQALGYRANFGLGTGHEWIGYINGTSGPQTVIGDLPADPDGMYLMNFSNDNSALLGSDALHNAYHLYELRWENNLSNAYLDHGYQAQNVTQVPTSLLPLTLYNNDSEPTSLKLDWLYVRQYREAEPTVDMGKEQGLVDLELSIIDFPDPLPSNAELSYLLTITNHSNIDANEVVVTNTLPASVNYLRATPAEDCSALGKDIICTISQVPASSFASVTIVGKTTTDGTVQDHALATAYDYDLDLSNNISQQSSLVDSVPPVVTWVKPITYGEIFTSYGGLVPLEVTASDNDQIANVEFWWYDEEYILIGKVSAEPYRTFFNTNLLKVGKDYFFEVRAFDRAGNSNFPKDRQYIYIRRAITDFLPVILK